MRQTYDLEAIANRFAESLRKRLTPAEWREMVTRNTYDDDYQDGACASHDFCDANVYMGQAFEHVMGRPSECASENDAEAWSRAWEIARRNHLGDASWRK